MNQKPRLSQTTAKARLHVQSNSRPQNYDTFLWAAVGSIALSLVLVLTGEEKKANFVGQWAPTLLILGLHNKMVKLHGSDAQNSAGHS